MALVVAAPSGTQVLEVIDELDRFDPLDLLEPAFVLAAETERGAVIDVERLAVHFESQERPFMLHVLKSVDVVITPAVAPVSEAFGSIRSSAGLRRRSKVSIARLLSKHGPVYHPASFDGEVLRSFFPTSRQPQFRESPLTMASRCPTVAFPTPLGPLQAFVEVPHADPFSR